MKKGLYLSLGHLLLLVGAILAGIFLAGHHNLPVAEQQTVLELKEPKAKIVSFSGADGFNVDQSDLKNIVIKITDAQLSDSDTWLNFTIGVARDDVLRDENGAGYIFQADIEGLQLYDSWNESVSDKVSFVDYDKSTDAYSVDINGVEYKFLPYRFELKQGLSQNVEVHIKLNSKADFHNIVKEQFDSKEIGYIVIQNSNNKEMAKITLRYTRSE